MKIKILFSIIAILFVSVLYLLYLKLQTKPEIKVSKSTQTNPIISPVLWKTYEDKYDGITFQYPSSYQIDENFIPNGSMVMIKGKDFKVEHNDFATRNSGSYYDLSTNTSCLPTDIVGDKKILLSNENYVLYSITGYEAPNYKTVIFKHNNLCFELSCNSETGCINDQYTEFKQIISLFKFLYPTNTAIVDKQIGYIKKAYYKNNKQYIDIDYIQFVDDKTQPNNFRIVNTNSQLRTFEITPNVDIYLIDWTNQGMITPKINFNDFIKIIDHTSPEYNLGPDTPFDIQIDGQNRVSEIKIRYVP